MKLSPKEAAVIGGFELRAGASIASVRKEVGLRDHSIRHALHRLKSRGVITSIPFIDLHRLGFSICNLFFTLGASKRTAQNSLLKALTDTPEIVWVGEFGGEYQYGIAVCARNFGTVMGVISQLSRRHHGSFFDKAVSVQYGCTVYPRGYLCSKRFSAPPLVTRTVPELEQIDELDERIIAGMAHYGEISHRELAQALGVPASTIDLRVKGLIKRKIFVGHLLAVDCTQYGYQPYKLLIYSKGMDPAFTEGLHKFCAAHPNVVYLIECLGTWDYEIGVEVARAEDVSAITQSLFEEFGSSVTTIKLLTKFKDVKFRWFPGE